MLINVLVTFKILIILSKQFLPEDRSLDLMNVCSFASFENYSFWNDYYRQLLDYLTNYTHAQSY
jgi:hypothetical protein